MTTSHTLFLELGTGGMMAEEPWVFQYRPSLESMSLYPCANWLTFWTENTGSDRSTHTVIGRDEDTTEHDGSLLLFWRPLLLAPCLIARD
jgi:hypothetical protein